MHEKDLNKLHASTLHNRRKVLMNLIVQSITKPWTVLSYSVLESSTATITISLGNNKNYIVTITES
jgi:hypothetical protein